MSTIRQIILFVLSLALALSLVKCKHEPPPEVPKVCQYDSSVEEMKKWYYFKTGTWWVYQEQTTGDLDTITVYYDWEGTNSSGTVGFEWTATSSWDGYDQYYIFNDSYSIHCITAETCTCHKVKRARGLPGNFVGEAQIFLYPLIEENYTNLIGFPNGQITGGTSTITDTNLNYVFENEIIQNVVRWEVTTDQSIGGWPSVYLIAKDIGIVQRTHPHTNELWELINYQVIQ
jgi:hypothetical protein